MKSNHKPQEQIYQHSTRQNGTSLFLRVNAKITGKPRSRVGVWLIKLGVRLARVHVRVWIDEERRRAK